MKHLKTWRASFTQIDLKGATLKIKDGTAITPLEVVVTIGEGNLTWSEKRNIEYQLNRGLLADVREGDQVPCEVSFDFRWDYYTGNGTATPSDALTKTGDASAWVSSDTVDACRPYAVDLELEYIPRNCTTADKETLTFADFRQESIDYDLRAGTISCSGKCNVIRPTSVRAAQP